MSLPPNQELMMTDLKAAMTVGCLGESIPDRVLPVLIGLRRYFGLRLYHPPSQAGRKFYRTDEHESLLVERLFWLRLFHV